MSANEKRRGRTAHYPVMLDLAGRDVLIVGGGAVAARKASALISAGARLRIVAPALGPALQARHEAGEFWWEARQARAGDTDGTVLVVCAAGDRQANELIAVEARAAGIPVAVADAPHSGSVTIPASLRRGRLVISVSSSGGSPALAAFVRGRLEAAVGPEFAQLTELASLMREQGRAAGLDAATRERAAATALPQLLELLQAGRTSEAEALALLAAAPDTAEVAP